MKKNVSNVDRIIRVLLAAVLVYLYYSGVVKGTVGLVLTIAGVVLLLTSIFSFCPIYAIFGISTNGKKKA